MAQVNQVNKRNNTIIAVLIVTFLVVVILLAFIFRTTLGISTSSSVTVKVPLIKTKMTASDGQDYTVQSKFSVQMDQDTRKTVSTAVLQQALTEIMKEMDFDALAAQNGVEYVNQVATDALNKYLEDYTDTKVYVTDMLVGDRYSLSDDSTSTRDDVMKGLFQNIK